MAYLRYTTSAKIYGSDSVPGFPLILTSSQQVHFLSLHYFLDKSKAVAISSLKTYAQHLCDFLSQLEIDDCIECMSCVDDDYLHAYKESIINRSGHRNKESYAVAVISSVLSYLMWLENSGFFFNLIGETPEHKVRVTINHRKKIKHPLTKLNNSKQKTVVVPRSDWIDSIVRFGPKDEVSQKVFELMVDYAKVLGLRAKEVCSLKIADLPSIDTVKKKLDAEESIYLHLKITKGSKEANIPIPHQLALNTWNYIEYLRPSRIKVAKRKAKAELKHFVDDGYIFLNSNGERFSERGFSNSVRRAFLKAVEAGNLTEDERVWLHGLRHHAITKILRALDASGAKKPEAITRVVSRHASDDTLEPYTSDRFDETFR